MDFIFSIVLSRNWTQPMRDSTHVRPKTKERQHTTTTCSQSYVHFVWAGTRVQYGHRHVRSCAAKGSTTWHCGSWCFNVFQLPTTLCFLFCPVVFGTPNFGGKPKPPQKLSTVSKQFFHTKDVDVKDNSNTRFQVAKESLLYFSKTHTNKLLNNYVFSLSRLF